MRRLLVVMILWAGCGDEGPKAMVIGASSVSIDTRKVHVRVGEAAIGDWMADLLLREVKKHTMTAPAVALINAGGIRGGDDRNGKIQPAGPITDLDVTSWFPFNDDHLVFDITGTQLKSALERGVSQLPPDIKGGQGGALFQVSGMSYVVDCAGAPQQLNAMDDMIMTEGTRIKKMTIGSDVVLDGTVDKLATTSVRVVVSNFAAEGRDGHLAFLGKTAAALVTIAMFDLVAAMKAEVTATSPIAPMTSGRITIVGDCGRPLTEP